MVTGRRRIHSNLRIVKGEGGRGLEGKTETSTLLIPSTTKKKKKKKALR
jgi:hypothetical protein